jgi:hypothetical protein
LILKRHSQLAQKPSEGMLQWSLNFWPEFKNEVEQELGVPTEEFTSFMAAIARTGMYEIITGTYFDYEGGVGFLTSRFFRLESYVKDETSNI